MKKSLALILFSSFFSISINAVAETKFAGTEVATNTNTAMSTNDLSKTQEILSSLRTGAVDSWYNTDSTTHFDVKVGEHYTTNQRPCIAYTLTTKHSSQTQNQNLNACMDYEGHWVSESSSLSM